MPIDSHPQADPFSLVPTFKGFYEKELCSRNLGICDFWIFHKIIPIWDLLTDTPKKFADLRLADFRVKFF
jgi:hypothetical protein